ncbi:MAG: META domain-containing protein [Saprospiraceae bacterium]|nr:META domain-containing protein [Saprospiraceae bacterium]
MLNAQKITCFRSFLHFSVMLAAMVYITGCKCDQTKLYNATWVLDQYGPSSALVDALPPVPPGGKPEVILTLDNNGGFSGNDGCNQVFGAYKFGKKCEIQFVNVSSTLMFCQQNIMTQASAYTAILKKVSTFKVTDSTLKLSTPDNEILKFHKK